MTVFGLSRSEAPALIEPISGRTVSFADLLKRGSWIVAPLGDSRQMLFLFSRNDMFTAIAYSGSLVRSHAVALLDAGASPTTNAALVNAYMAPWLAGPCGLADSMREQSVPIVSVITIEGGEVIRTAYLPACIRILPSCL